MKKTNTALQNSVSHRYTELNLDSPLSRRSGKLPVADRGPDPEKKKLRQKQAAYIAYLVGGSFFKTCVCLNPLREKSLFLYYSDMRSNEQNAKEAALDRVFYTSLSYSQRKYLRTMGAEVIFTEQDGQFEVLFDTLFETVKAVIAEDGSVTVNWISSAE